MLNSDQLGKKGEARFSEICSDAQLTCNPSTYDRTGWDFIVEFPYGPPDRQSTLDKRHSPISCHVQVKTMWSSNDEFRIRLSSAERLAKEPKPAFVYVLKVNKKLKFIAAHLVHVLDDNLATILKRLRKEQAKGVKAIAEINKKQIAFRASRSGQSLPLTGEGLRDALRTLCGSDPNSYMEKKREQLKKLGFEGRPYEASTTLIVSNHEELVDFSLGLKEVAVGEFKAFETRFGIKLPVSDREFTKGTMQLRPNPADRCTIAVREDALLPPAVFEGDIFLPAIPNLPKESIKFLVKSRLFRIFIEHQHIAMSVDWEGIKSASLKFDDWVNFLKMLSVLYRGTGTVTITPSKLAAGSFRVTKTVEGADTDVQYLLKAFEGAQYLFRLCGVTEPDVQLEGIAPLASHIVGLSKIFSGEKDISPLSFRTNVPEGGAQFPITVDALYVNFISIGGNTLAHYSVVKLIADRQGGDICWRSSSIDPREIVFLKDFPVDYQTFVDQAKEKSKIDALVLAHPPTE